MKMLIFILLLFLGKVVVGAVYFISPSGDNSNDGTFNSPWYSLKFAYEKASPGDTIFLRGGVYYGLEQSIVIKKDYLYIRSYPGEWAVIDGKGIKTPDHGMIRIEGSKGVIIDSIEIRNSYSRWGILIYGGDTHDNIVKNCVIHDIVGDVGSNPAGIAIHSAYNNIIEKCLLYNNRIVSFNGFNENQAGFVSFQGYHNIIKNNIVFNESYGIKSKHGELPNKAKPNRRDTFKNNIIFNCDGIAFSTNRDSIYVLNNLVFNTLEFGDIGHGGGKDGGDYAIFKNNTAILKNGRGFYVRNHDGGYYGNYSIFKNNIIWCSGSGEGQELLIYPYSDGHSLPLDFISDYNCFFGPDQFVSFISGNRYTFEQHKNIFNLDLHSYNQKPDFIDETNLDFRLKPNTSLRDENGNPIGVNFEDLKETFEVWKKWQDRIPYKYPTIYDTNLNSPQNLRILK